MYLRRNAREDALRRDGTAEELGMTEAEFKEVVMEEFEPVREENKILAK